MGFFLDPVSGGWLLNWVRPNVIPARRLISVLAGIHAAGAGGVILHPAIGPQGDLQVFTGGLCAAAYGAVIRDKALARRLGLRVAPFHRHQSVAVGGPLVGLAEHLHQFSLGGDTFSDSGNFG